MSDKFWQTKLHARLHDPAEKALVLLRDPVGHENRTSSVLRRELGFDQLPVKDWLETMYKDVKRADWWAAAADRPQWPMEEKRVGRADGTEINLKLARWAQVRWYKEPVLLHPLTGDKFDLKELAGTEITDITQRSLEHFRSLIRLDPNGGVDWRKTLLAFWRFGPELREERDGGKLGELWPLLPADTRVPDHSIWDHLDLTSAFAGAFCRDRNSGIDQRESSVASEDATPGGDRNAPGEKGAAEPGGGDRRGGTKDGEKGQAALLSLSIGPVQSFIAAARTTSDLWAGSHLLSRLSWEAIKVVCEELGPDAVLFPRLRGLPQVDVWLRNEIGLPSDWFKQCDWTESNTDANPLFAAALPNRFVAVVPESEAGKIAEKVRHAVRDWLRSLGERVVQRLLQEAGLDSEDDSSHCFRQVRRQLEGYPEVHWSAVPFSLIGVDNPDRETGLNTNRLEEAMRPFFSGVDGCGSGQSLSPGFLGSDAWRVLGEGAKLEDGTAFFSPNPGVLYPAMQDLSERVLAAAKAVRPFGQCAEQGWRCSLTGETEWLTTDPEQLFKSYRRQQDTLWAKLAEKRPSWVKQGEHLGALPAVKRLWPTLFAEEVGRIIHPHGGAEKEENNGVAAAAPGGQSASRFVVSTHTMALAGNLERLNSKLSEDHKARTVLDRLVRPSDYPPALPRKLARKKKLKDSLAAKAPAALERLREAEGAGEDSGKTEDAGKALRDLEKVLKNLLGHKLDTYYALIMFDGDHMGRILSGEAENCAITYRESFHPRVQQGFENLAQGDQALTNYGKQRRAVSPNRHLAISAALNDFALHVVPEVVESEHAGRVIYAGGDDVLAMLPVSDLLSAMPRLRESYSGTASDDVAPDWGKARNAKKLVCKDGFVLMPRRRGAQRLLRMMGKGATASCGAVVAHHQTPLGHVLQELRDAEKRAKNEGGRNAFSLTILKRSGGALRCTHKWHGVECGTDNFAERSVNPIELLRRLRKFLADDRVSRRAAYHCLAWLQDLPAKPDPEMLESLLAHQLARQKQNKLAWDCHDVPGLAKSLTRLALSSGETNSKARPRERLKNFLSVAEFFAREVRSSEDGPVAVGDNGAGANKQGDKSLPGDGPTAAPSAGAGS